MKQVGRIETEILSRPIFRIDTIDRLYETLADRRLVFVRPVKWRDPLENIVFNAEVIRNGKPYIHPGRDGIYAQCWTLDPDSYALWQIYTKGSPGVRLGTRFEKLSEIELHNKGDYFYGKVEYYYKKDLDVLPKNRDMLRGLASTTISTEHIKTLLIKRKSYRYEKEIRLISVPDKSIVDKHDHDLAYITIDPLSFFTSLRFDPRLSYEEFMGHKNRLVRQYGFRKEQISLSTLNQKNRLKFVLS